jgi:hypothetical protein
LLYFAYRDSVFVRFRAPFTSLSHAKIENGVFTFWLEIPLALGTVGGLTTYIR